MDFWRFLVTAISLVVVSKFVIDTIKVYIQCNSKRRHKYESDDEIDRIIDRTDDR